MRTLRLRQPRWISRTGRILTHVTIVNALDPARELSCQALVDTGAWGLMLPRAWKERLGAFQMTRTVEMLTADQRLVSGEVCGPVTIQIEGFEPVSSEVTFVDMELEGGRYPGSGTSSRVTSQGPVGPCVSKLLPITQVGEWNCQSRTETSLPTM